MWQRERVSGKVRAGKWVLIMGITEGEDIRGQEKERSRRNEEIGTRVTEIREEEKEQRGGNARRERGRAVRPRTWGNHRKGSRIGGCSIGGEDQIEEIEGREKEG
ncbi:hypothetical protein HPB48_017090 [Haemaphysalis longicornis]|uniref:Uncharacterized protein n=1 Tax=Haemaphysalis longicornis TaxID=44386 RepID=A0A9J6G8W9_HAELO|nr:hypothetical protein HPB48_017090 [Haemaphysalis longicornis]